MGLDSMLYIRRTLGYFPGDDKLKSLIQKSITSNTYIEESSIEIKYCVGYWCKCYSIDQWFVGEGTPEGNRDGGVVIPLYKLSELKDICIEILRDKSKAKDLLPQSSSDSDQTYMFSVLETIRILNGILGDASLYPTETKFIFKNSW